VSPKLPETPEQESCAKKQKMCAQPHKIAQKIEPPCYPESIFKKRFAKIHGFDASSSYDLVQVMRNEEHCSVVRKESEFNYF